MNDELLIKLGYNGIEHLVAQLQTLDQYQFPTEPFKPSPSGTGAVWGKITGNLEDQADLIARLDSLQTTIEAAILAEIGNAFTYKGSVATYNDLPTEGNKIGDIYNVVETGANYAWDGSEWDKLSETIDLSGYVDKDLFEETLKLYDMLMGKSPSLRREFIMRNKLSKYSQTEDDTFEDFDEDE